ncbi:MAG: ATP-binding protein [Ruminococcaceae bacterium]|nr:ATP-binding protein [Oscillospiraceae bacterium]
MRELSLNILDITENSVSAGASLIEIDILENTEDKTLSVIIRDNGRGMSEEMLRNVRDPFCTTRTTRKVGMGIPLFRMAAEMTGGHLELESELGVGTTISGHFKTDSIDFTPLGDIDATILTLITMHEDIDFVYRFKIDENEFVLKTSELKAILGEVSFNDIDVRMWLKDYISEQTQIIRGGVT